MAEARLISRILSPSENQRAMTIYLATQPKLSHSQPEARCDYYPELSKPAGAVLGQTGGLFPLLCLAPRGVYPALPVTWKAVSSYLAFSPLPPPA